METLPLPLYLLGGCILGCLFSLAVSARRIVQMLETLKKGA